MSTEKTLPPGLVAIKHTLPSCFQTSLQSGLEIFPLLSSRTLQRSNKGQQATHMHFPKTLPMYNQ